MLKYTKAEAQAVAMKDFVETVDRLAQAKDPFKLTADIDSFSKVSDETRLLVEILDIQDELDIIKSVFSKQEKVLEQLRCIVVGPDPQRSAAANPLEPTLPHPAVDELDLKKTRRNTAFKSASAVDQALHIVRDNIARVEGMTNSAKRIPDGVRRHIHLPPFLHSLTVPSAEAVGRVQAATGQWMGGALCEEAFGAGEAAEHGMKFPT